MKIIIEHSQTKREIKGSFNICASVSDLREIAEQINMRLKISSNMTYGWISIVEPADSIVNTEPKGWDE
jgi:hypothetical protein